MPKLNAKKVEALSKPGRYGDGDGLHLLVSPGGSKSWVLRTVVQGTRRDIGLGGLSWVSLAEARDRARAMRKIAREGGDPRPKQRDEKDLPTFEETARKVYQVLRPGWRAGGVHVKHWIASLENHAFPAIGQKRIDQIQSGDILAVLQPMWFKVPETARRVRQRLRQVMQWAKGHNLYHGENPVDAAAGSLPRQGEKAQHLAAMPYDDVPTFLRELQGRKGVAALALRFTVLTAARSGETRGARWDEFDFENAVWAVPALRMKRGVEHRVPLCAEALAVLEKVRGLDPDLVFPGLKRGRPMSDATLAAVLKRMGREVTVHGFRSTFRDWAAERTNTPREIAEIALSHEVGNAVERAYRRSDLFDKRRDLMERWERFCVSAGAEVVQIGGRA